MIYLAHRGFWAKPVEKNSETAIRRSFENGFGIETDVRDLDGRLVISHDPPSGQPMSFDRFLDIYCSYPQRTLLALNVKADGLQSALSASLQHYGVSNYVVFDMSVPDLLGYRRANMPYLVRRSEYEGASSLDRDAAGAWLDSFEHAYADEVVVNEVAAAVAGPIALVSPELHGRPHLDAWTHWRDLALRHRDRLAVCTDFPDQARSFFELQKD